MARKKLAGRNSSVRKSKSADPAVGKSRRAHSSVISGSNGARLNMESRPLIPDGLPDGDDVSRQAIRLGFLVHDVSRMRRAAYDQLMKPLNFTRARWWVLAHLSRHDGMMQSQLADVLEVGKASLGSVIEQLEVDGWLERRSDPSDKRAKRVYLTRAAQPFIKRMTLEEDQFNNRILGKLDGTDRATLIRLLSLLKESLQQFSKSSGTD